MIVGVEHDEVVRFVLLEAGRVVDEYLSVPEHYGALPPGDADRPRREPTRRRPAHGRRSGCRARDSPHGRLARPAAAAASCFASIAATIGLQGAEHGWEERDHAARRGAVPYCARVRIVLAEKDVPYETVEIDLANRPTGCTKNPVGKVPVLEEDGWVLPESAVIAEYLDERYRAAALAGGRRRAGGRASARLPLRRLPGRTTRCG